VTPPLPFPTSYIDPPESQTQAIIAAAYNLPDRSLPTFGSRCIITSDGFIMADFTSRDGEHHSGAFVGAHEDLLANIASFISHFELNPSQADDLRAKIKAWPSQDYRS